MFSASGPSLIGNIPHGSKRESLLYRVAKGNTGHQEHGMPTEEHLFDAAGHHLGAGDAKHRLVGFPAGIASALI